MSTFASTGKASGVSKLTADRNHRILLDLVAQPGNDVCADCKAKAPRWASHNLGIFICVHCASIHRKIGTHITKVKSLTLDDWSKDQVENMRTIGNIRANEYWNPDEAKHPLPTNMEESERDSELEKYIRSKYQFQRFRPVSARVAEKLGPSQSLQSRTPFPSTQSQSQSAVVPPPKRSHTAPIRSDPPSQASNAIPSVPALESRSFSSGYGATGAGTASSSFASGVGVPPRRSSFNPFPSSASTISSVSSSTFSPSAPAPPPNHQASLTRSTFDDLISIQAPSLSSSLPLQYSSPETSFQQYQAPQSQPFQMSMTTGLNPTQTQSPSFTPSFGTPSISSTNPYANLSMSPAGSGAPFSSSISNTGMNFRSSSLPTSIMNPSPLGSSPNTFQQQQTFSPAPNPFTQMQAQQQYGGTPLASNTPSPFYSPQQQQHQQTTPFQQQGPGGMFQTPTSSPYAGMTQAQQAQQVFQGMAGGGGVNNPFAQWGGT